MTFMCQCRKTVGNKPESNTTINCNKLQLNFHCYHSNKVKQLQFSSNLGAVNTSSTIQRYAHWHLQKVCSSVNVFVDS